MAHSANWLSVQEVDRHIKGGRNAHPQDIRHHQGRGPLAHLIKLGDSGCDQYPQRDNGEHAVQRIFRAKEGEAPEHVDSKLYREEGNADVPRSASRGSPY